MNNQYTEDENKIIDSFKVSTQKAVEEIKSDNTKFEFSIKAFGQAWINMQYALEDLSLDSLSFKKESPNVISQIQAEGIVYLIDLMEKEIPEYTKNENNKPTLKTDIRANIGQELMKLNLDFNQRNSLIDGLSTFVKPTVVTEPENKIEKPVVVQDFSQTLKVIEVLDDVTLNRKFNLMSDNQITKTISEAGQIFIQEVKEGKADLHTCFEKFSTVWYAIPFTNEKRNVALETLREFKYNLAEQLPEYSNKVEGRIDLQGKVSSQLATQLAKSELFNQDFKDIVVIAMTDFDKFCEKNIPKTFVKPELNKTEGTTNKLKNN